MSGYIFYFLFFSLLEGHNIKCSAINFEIVEIDGWREKDKWMENRVQMG